MAEEQRTVFPLQQYPIAYEGSLIVTLSWSRLFTSLWNLSGGGATPSSSPIVLRLVGGGFLGAYDATTGELYGIIPLENIPGGPEQAVPAGVSPLVYGAITDGTLVVFSGQLELQRGSGGFRKVSLTGGALPMKPGDSARVTWYGADPPGITWYPDYQT